MGEYLTFEEHRKLILEELIYLRDICDKNNMKYFLYGGTLLGAVKYKGFIPWDDDIDIALLRDDYEKLLKILEENENEDYKVLHIYNNSSYYYRFAKLVSKKTKLVENAKKIKELGAYVDIFPLDGISDNYEDTLHNMRFLMNLSAKRMRIKNHITKSVLKEQQVQKISYKRAKDFIYNMADYLTMPLGYQFWVKLLDKKVKKYKIQDCKYVARYKYFNEVFEKSLFEEIAIYEFENHKFKSIKNYDKYLTQVYGDYMGELPKEEQCSHHSMKVSWRK